MSQMTKSSMPLQLQITNNLMLKIKVQLFGMPCIWSEIRSWDF